LTTGTENISGGGYYAYGIFCVSDTKKTVPFYNNTNRRCKKCPQVSLKKLII
jgi:hypothetical protein